MKTPERFNRAIKAGVTAFFDGSLAKGDCAACYVGNMVAAGYGKKVHKINGSSTAYCEINNVSWFDLISPTSIIKIHNPASFDNIKRTGYSIEELTWVEHAFEKNTFISIHRYRDCTKKQIMEDQYKGLMAVVEVLCDIEGLNADEYKSMFEYDEELKALEL